jgi:hypothetical protein
MAADPSRRPLYTILAVAAAVLLCLCLAGVAVGGYFLLQGREVTADEPAVEYVLDASARMSQPAEGAEGSRLQVAQNILAEVIRPADPAVTAGLRVFGSGAVDDSCADTDLVVPLAPASQPAIADRIKIVQSGGNAEAALAEAIIAAIGDLGATAGPHTLVVVTGGEDSCQPETGRLIAEEAERAGIELQTFVVGFQVDEAGAQAIKEMVESVEDGVYLDAPDASALQAIINAVQGFVDEPETTTVADVIAIGASPQPTPGPAEATTVAQATASGDGPTPQATAGGDEPQPQPTATPDAPAPTAQGQDGPVDTTGYPSQTACDHPYFPMREGSVWNYSGDGVSLSWTVGEVTGDNDNAEAVISATVAELSLEYHWICDTTGLLSYDYGTAGLTSGSISQIGEVTYEVVDTEGSFLPPADELEAGATWTNAFTINTTVSFEGQTLTSSTVMDSSYTAAGFESVTTPAGTFEALRIEQVSTITSTTFGQSFTTVNNGVGWFVLGVGMVRNQSSVGEVSSALELVSYSIPN